MLAPGRWGGRGSPCPRACGLARQEVGPWLGLADQRRSTSRWGCWSSIALLATTIIGCNSSVATFSVSALAVAPDQGEISTGDEVLVTAQVQNTGTLAGTYDAALSVDGAVGSQSQAKLAPGESTTLSFRIKAGSPGDHEIRLGEETASLRVTAPTGPVFSVSALALSPGPGEILTGTKVQVTAQVQNTGTLAGTYDAALSVDGAVRSQSQAELAPGESTTLHLPSRRGHPATTRSDWVMPARRSRCRHPRPSR